MRPTAAPLSSPGVTNLGISTAVAHLGLYYAPDPSSQLACSIGGNVAENSGGIHCLKYGLTTNNILGIQMVLMDGSVIRLGGKHLDSGGYDLLGLMTGSEGLLGIVTEVTVRLLAKPAAARAMLIGLPSMEQAGACVGAVLSAGIIPAGMELLDQISVQAIERYAKIGYPLTVAAMMIVELDGTAAEVDHLVAAVEDIATAHGASYFRKSESGGGANRLLVRSQSSLCGLGAVGSGLLLYGWLGTAAQSAGGAFANEAARRPVRTAGRQCLSRR